MNIKKIASKWVYFMIANMRSVAYMRTHKKELNNYQIATGLKLNKQEGEDEFVAKWKPLYKKVNKDFFRFYSHYIGPSPDIVSDDIFHIIIEPILNNQSASSVYSDKNMFEKLVDPSLLPICILRKMEGDYMDNKYHILEMTDVLFGEMVLKNEHLQKLGRLIVKPSIDTGGGAGVRLFVYEDGDWKSNDGLMLSKKILDRYYKNNFIMQECIEPSPFVRQFNETSYNTLRLFTYRSVNDDQPHFIGGYMRVGAKGSFKDNVWGGGYACPINPDGTLANFAGDANRKRYDNINGISLADKKFEIPNFNKVLDLVYKVALVNTPNRLLSFDIMIDKDNIPHMIEFNIKHQTVTTVQTLQHPFFGDYTDEVIEYCLKNKGKICYPFCLRLE